MSQISVRNRNNSVRRHPVGLFLRYPKAPAEWVEFADWVITDGKFYYFENLSIAEFRGAPELIAPDARTQSGVIRRGKAVERCEVIAGSV